MRYTIQVIRYEAGTIHPVLWSVSTEDLPEAELRRALRRYFGPYLDNPDNRTRPERMARAIRALDENGAEVDRWTVEDEEATRFVENR